MPESKKKKEKTWMWVAAGGGALLLYLWYKNSSSSASSSVSALPTLGANTTAPVVYGTPPTSTTPADTGTSSSSTTATDAQLQAVQQALASMTGQYDYLAGQVSVLEQSQQNGGKPPSTQLAPSYAPITVSGTTTKTQARQIAQANPGAPVNYTNSQQQPAYEIAKANSRGQLSVASSYDAAVNAAGGQWLNHQWFAGGYNGAGKFVTKNTSAQKNYNGLVPANAG